MILTTKKHLLVAGLLAATCLGLAIIAQPTFRPNTKAAIFDLGGVLFEVNNGKLIKKKVGMGKIISYILGFNNPFKLQEKAFNILYQMRGEEKPAKKALIDPMHPLARGLPMPEIMMEWQLGIRTPTELLEEVNAYVAELAANKHFSSKLQKQLLETILTCIFDAKERIAYTDPIQEGWDLLNWYKENGYEIYVLSNMDHDTMDLLQENYPDLFARIDGVVYSAEVREMKPWPSIFNHLLDKFRLEPQQCVFHDDQIENINSAKELGFETLHCTAPKVMKKWLKQIKADTPITMPGATLTVASN